MYTIINRKKAFLMSILLCCFILVICSRGSFDKPDRPINTYKTPEKAIAAFVFEKESSTDTQTEKGTSGTYTVNRFQDSAGKTYFLINDFQYTENKRIPYVYVLKLVEEKGEYFCVKETADYSLLSNEDVNDAEYVPYTKWEFQVSDQFIHTGLVLDSNYSPYLGTYKLSVDEEGRYIGITNNINDTVHFEY